MAIERLVEGWTQRLIFQLKKWDTVTEDWIPIPAVEINGTTVTLIMRDKDGVAITIAGTVGWLSTDNATVYFDPDDEDLQAADSPIAVHWKIHDTSHKDVFIPKGEGDVWIVSAQ